METIKLNNGIECPVIGIGTFMLKPSDAQNSVREALKMGYSLVDTANAYVNERAVGRGIKESGLKREDVFISTKLWPSEYENENAVDETLERLGVDYVDLLYILHEFRYGFFEEILNVLHATDSADLQELSDFFSPGLFLRTAFSSAAHY